MAKTKAHTRYLLESGESAVGVTTVLNILNKPALVKWANNLGLQGIDSSKARDQAADIGTIAHIMILAELTNTKAELDEYSNADIKTAENSLKSFHEWRKEHELKVILTETPLVSDKYAYGGTPDCLAYINGELELLDFKTSKAIWNNYYYQIAAYRQLLIEHGYPELNRARILRISKDDNAGFEDQLITSFDDEFKLFHHCLAIYYLLKSMNRRL